MPVAGGVEASPLPDIASVPPGQILGAAGDCMPAAREHANSTFPWARLKKNPPANACGGQGLRRRLRRAFLGTFSRFPLFSSPENPSFGDHKVQLQTAFRRGAPDQKPAAPEPVNPLTRRARVHETPERVTAASSQPYAFRSAAYAWLRRRESAASLPKSDGHPMANTKGHESSIRRSRTLPPLYGSSQLLGGRAHMYHARNARQVRATLAPLAANGRPMRTAKSRFAVAHGRPRAHSLAQRQHPSRSLPARLEPSGFAAERRPHTCRIPTAIRCRHEESRIVNPMIPDLAAAVRRLSAAQRTHPHIYRSDRTPSPDHPCAARRERPSHADTDMALRCRPRTPPTPQLGAEAAPIQIAA